MAPRPAKNAPVDLDACNGRALQTAFQGSETYSTVYRTVLYCTGRAASRQQVSYEPPAYRRSTSLSLARARLCSGCVIVLPCARPRAPRPSRRLRSVNCASSRGLSSLDVSNSIPTQNSPHTLPLPPRVHSRSLSFASPPPACLQCTGARARARCAAHRSVISIPCPRGGSCGA